MLKYDIEQWLLRLVDKPHKHAESLTIGGHRNTCHQSKYKFIGKLNSDLRPLTYPTGWKAETNHQAYVNKHFINKNQKGPIII